MKIVRLSVLNYFEQMFSAVIAATFAAIALIFMYHHPAFFMRPKCFAADNANSFG